MTIRRRPGRIALLALTAAAGLAMGAATSLLGACGPFTDTAADSFCPFVLEIFTMGITTGTTPTTFTPSDDVTRLQMAAFLSRTVDRVVNRGSRRAALEQFWTPRNPLRLPTTAVGDFPRTVAFDGADLWVSNGSGNSISRVRASDGKFLEEWTGATLPTGVLVAMGHVFAAAQTEPGKLYRIDPSQPAGAVTTVATSLGDGALDIAFDGIRIWTANSDSVSRVTPGAVLPWTVTTVSTGFNLAAGILYDGVNIWVTDANAGTLLKLDDSAAVLQTVTVGTFPFSPTFDGTNIWVVNNTSDSISVVRASSGAVLATLTGNGLSDPNFAAFDGERVLVSSGAANTVSLWKAADLSPIGSFSTGIGTLPAGICSDGVNFWIALASIDKLARF